MLDLTVLDELPTTSRIRTRPREKKQEMQVLERRSKWRMTLDELCAVACITPVQLHQWASEGILEKRLAPKARAGRAPVITREAAQRTVLVSRLVAAGVHPLAAGHIAQGHKTNDFEPLQADLPCGVTITIQRKDLP